MEYCVGIDLGGTNIVAGAVACDGSRLEGMHAVPTRPAEGADRVIARMADAARTAMAAARRADPAAAFAGAGIGAPGPLDTTSGVVLLTPNLGWTDMPLRQRLADLLALPTTLDNDANCAILGEWWRGAARGAHHAIGVTVGTGIGGGIILDGRLYHGVSDVAGEIGHTTIDAHGRRCACGNDGCVEAYASGPAIARRAVEAVQAGEASALSPLVAGDPTQVTAETVFLAAAAGDALAREVVRDTARYLGAAVANLINVFNPDVVVILGGVTRAGDALFVPLRQEIARRAFRPAVAACRIVPGALDGTAGVYGAVAAFREHFPTRVSHPAGSPRG